MSTKPWSSETGIPQRYLGKGVQQAVANINQSIAGALQGLDACRQVEGRPARCWSWTGRPNKADLGANALLAVSLAVARAAAQARGEPL